MCLNCGDFVDMCWEDACYNPNGGRYGKAKKFYVDDKYCRHMQEKYGHEIASWADLEEELNGS